MNNLHSNYGCKQAYWREHRFIFQAAKSAPVAPEQSSNEGRAAEAWNNYEEVKSKQPWHFRKLSQQLIAQLREFGIENEVNKQSLLKLCKKAPTVFTFLENHLRERLRVGIDVQKELERLKQSTNAGDKELLSKLQKKIETFLGKDHLLDRQEMDSAARETYLTLAKGITEPKNLPFLYSELPVRQSDMLELLRDSGVIGNEAYAAAYYEMIKGEKQEDESTGDESKRSEAESALESVKSTSKNIRSEMRSLNRRTREGATRYRELEQQLRTLDRQYYLHNVELRKYQQPQAAITGPVRDARGLTGREARTLLGLDRPQSISLTGIATAMNRDPAFSTVDGATRSRVAMERFTAAVRSRALGIPLHDETSFSHVSLRQPSSRTLSPFFKTMMERAGLASSEQAVAIYDYEEVFGHCGGSYRDSSGNRVLIWRDDTAAVISPSGTVLSDRRHWTGAELREAHPQVRGSFRREDEPHSYVTGKGRQRIHAFSGAEMEQRHRDAMAQLRREIEDKKNVVAERIVTIGKITEFNDPLGKVRLAIPSSIIASDKREDRMVIYNARTQMFEEGLDDVLEAGVCFTPQFGLGTTLGRPTVRNVLIQFTKAPTAGMYVLNGNPVTIEADEEVVAKEEKKEFYLPDNLAKTFEKEIPALRTIVAKISDLQDTTVLDALKKLAAAIQEANLDAASRKILHEALKNSGKTNPFKTKDGTSAVIVLNDDGTLELVAQKA